MSSTNIKGVVALLVTMILVAIVLAGCGGSSATPRVNNNYVNLSVESADSHFEPIYDLYMEFEQIMEAPEIPGTGESIKEMSFPMERPPEIPAWVADTPEAKREYVRTVIEASTDGSQSFVRHVSATGTQYYFNGADFVQSYGCAVYGNYAVLTAGGKTVYAMYSLSGLTDDRPVSIQANAAVVTGEYYIAVANYSTGSWDFFGPFETQTTVTINSETVTERYLSAMNTLHYAILTYDDGEVWIIDSMIDAYPIGSGSFSTKPHMPMINFIGVRGDGDKSPSMLDPSQYTDISWIHLYDPADPNSEAVLMHPYRQDPGETDEAPIGGRNDSAELYTDPTNNDNPSESETTPGEIFIYTTRSFNPTGWSSFTADDPVTITLLPPADVSATDGEFSDKISVSWSAVNGADTYDIYRDDVVVATDVTGGGITITWDDMSVGDNALHSYKVNAKNNLLEGGIVTSEFSDSDNGFVNGLPTANFTATPTSVQASWEVTFDASFCIDADTQGDEVYLYEWDWNDDGTYDESGNLAIVNHAFTTAGTKTIRLRFTDEEGASATTTIDVTVTNWTHTWGTDVTEGGISLTIDATSGNIYLGSNYQGTGADSYGIDIRKYDSAGSLLWAKTWNGPYWDTVKNIYLDSNGDLHLVGQTKSFSLNRTDDFLWLKYNASTGVLIHSKTFGIALANKEWATNILEDSNGDIFIGGFTRNNIAGDIVILKYSGTTGDLLDKKYIGGLQRDELMDMKIDTNDNLYFLAYTTSFGADAEDVLVVKVDSTLSLVWARRWGGEGSEKPTGFELDSSGNVYITGFTASENGSHGSTDAFLLSISSGGSFINDVRWGTSSSEVATSMVYNQVNDVIYLSVLMNGNQDSSLVAYTASTLELLSAQLFQSAYIENIWLDASNLYMTGRATDNTGIWSSFTGSSGPMSFSYSTPTELYISGAGGSTINRVGTEADAPTGVTDTGGGGYDLFIAKTDAL